MTYLQFIRWGEGESNIIPNYYWRTSRRCSWSFEWPRRRTLWWIRFSSPTFAQTCMAPCSRVAATTWTTVYGPGRETWAMASCTATACLGQVPEYSNRTGTCAYPRPPRPPTTTTPTTWQKVSAAPVPFSPLLRIPQLPIPIHPLPIQIPFPWLRVLPTTISSRCWRPNRCPSLPWSDCWTIVCEACWSTGVDSAQT